MKWRGGGRKKIELKLPPRTNKLKTITLFACPCECVYLQSVCCDVGVAHFAGHLLPFENFGRILDADVGQQTCSHYWIMVNQLLVSGINRHRVCVSYPSRPRGSWSTVSFGLTVAGWLTFKPPSLHYSLKSFTDATQTQTCVTSSSSGSKSSTLDLLLQRTVM